MAGIKVLNLLDEVEIEGQKRSVKSWVSSKKRRKTLQNWCNKKKFLLSDQVIEEIQNFHDDSYIQGIDEMPITSNDEDILNNYEDYE